MPGVVTLRISDHQVLPNIGTIKINRTDRILFGMLVPPFLDQDMGDRFFKIPSR